MEKELICLSRPSLGSTALRAMRIALVAGVFCSSAAYAQSNGVYSEDGNWQFQTTTDTVNKSAVQQLIELKKGNAFNSVFNYEYDYDINYDIDGNYINCSVSSNVTGNQGAIDQTAPIGSPTLTATPSFSATATGNSNETAVGTSVGGALIGGLNPNAGETLNETGDNSVSDLVGSTQTVTGSNLTSSVSDTTSTFNVGEANGHGGHGRVALNSSQTNSRSHLTANVIDSQACAFSDATGTGAANVVQ